MRRAWLPVSLFRRAVMVLVASGLLAVSVSSSSASAATEAAWLRLGSTSTPTYLKPGDEKGIISVTATNLGDSEVKASAEHPVVITDTLPEGVTAEGVRPPICLNSGSSLPACGIHWPGFTEVANCSVSAAKDKVTCTFTEALKPYERWEMHIGVKISAGLPSGAEGKINSATVEGGEANGDTLHKALKINSSPTPFGVEDYELAAEDDNGGRGEAQAGEHPFQLTTTLTFNRILYPFLKGPEPSVPEQTRNVSVNLPPGVIGNANKTIIHQCPEIQFDTVLRNGKANQCPLDTAIGAAVVTATEPASLRYTVFAVPVFNLVPSKGEPARFGFLAVKVPVILDTVLRGGDYHVVVNVKNTSQLAAILGSTVTIWGTPGDSRHDNARGWACLAGGANAEEDPSTKEKEKCEPPSERNTSPFLTLPTSCPGPLASTVLAQSWAFGSIPLSPFDAESPQALSGCESLPFSPTMSIAPLQHESNTPTGLKVVLKVPQKTTLETEGLAESDIRTTEVKLPEGVQLSPSAANGLASCSTAQIGFLGANPNTGTYEFSEAPPTCPDASKVGTVEIKTPVLEQPLHGNVYLAAENDNPFHSLFGIYIVVEDPVTGVLVKLAGKVELNPQTGRITNTFPNAPQLPFEELILELFNGPRASVATPRACGGYSSFTSFTPWSGTPAVEALLSPEEFNITSGPHGAPCANPQPFTPGVIAGTTEPRQQAGAFTGFTLSLTRADTDQQVSSLSTTLPPGVAGILKNVELCHEAEANAGTCPPSSLIGSATAVAGLGEDPFTVTGGRVYLTEKIKGTGPGAPFGLSVVIPAKAGPFDFGNVVTRARVEVDRNTAQVTVNTPEVPTMLNSVASSFPGCPHGSLNEGNGLCEVGTPVQLKRIDVTVDRPNFQFNPTNCSPLKITGTVGGDQGASTPISLPFQVTGCDKLQFSPELTAETSSKVTKVNGTSLVVKVKSSFGQANIGKTKIAFPEELPSRLTTIQKACRDTIFEVNPASCPEGSVIGMGIAHTPVLKNPLVGPVYLVSHGNTAFPDAEFVLQGEGITLVLDGKTDIKKGITTSEFNTVPDAPVELFEAILPAGPHSAFTGHGDLCKPTKPVLRKVTVKKRVKRGKRTRVVRVRKTVTVNVADPLRMPTILTGQNGNVIEKKTELKVSGCAKPKPKAKHHKKHSKKKKKHKRKK
jgi:hypothetical protein